MDSGGAGSRVTGPWGGFALVLLLTVAAGVLGHRISSDPPGHPGSAGGWGLVPWDDALLPDVVSAPPTDVLLDERRVTQRHPKARAGDPMCGVRVRTLLIDELQARDPQGTARRLREGLDHPPDRYRYTRRDSSLGS
jgi:hypothetical protein